MKIAILDGSHAEDEQFERYLGELAASLTGSGCEVDRLVLEATHTAPIARWLERLAGRLGCPCPGVIRRGGVEGIQQSPAFLTRGLFRKLRDLGRDFGRSGTLDRRRLEALAGPERVPRIALALATRLSAAVLWDRPLRRSGVFARRFDAPYLTQRAATITRTPDR